MSSEAAAEHAVHVHQAPTNPIWRYVFSTDHKVIGIQYWILALVSAFVGMGLSVWFRLHLLNQGHVAQLTDQLSLLVEGSADYNAIKAKIDALQTAWYHMEPSQYLGILTMHGTILVFMVLTTAPMGGFGNYFLPIQVGALDMAFPRLNMLSFWLTFLSFVTLMAAFFVPGGSPNAGWTGYPPLSAVPDSQGNGYQGPGGWGQDLWVLSIAIFCFASLVGAINFIVTTLDLRTKGMTLMRMPLTCWAWFVTAILALLSFAVLLVAGLLLLLDRNLGTSFYVPGDLFVSNKLLVDHKGGSPLLFQHLFWFFGHPEVYIAIVPGMGLASHLLSSFARKPVFGYRAMVYAIFGIGVLGFFVWGHHMFQSGMSPYVAVAFSVMTMVVGVPSAIKTFNWLGTIWGGNIRFQSPMLYALGFVSLFVTGGIGGIFLGQNAVDIYFHDTYFVVGHFHMIMGVAAIFGMFAGTVYWFPKVTGKMMNEPLSQAHFWCTFLGVNVIFIVMHLMGLEGHPRRYSGFAFEFLSSDYMVRMHTIVTHTAIFTASAQVLFLINLVYSLAAGKKAGDNPWESTSLEWATTSPPPFENFKDGVLPEVHHGPYEYSVPDAAKDYIMQHDPPEARPATAPAPH
ncbi:MAG: cbb3-type cytochrome c oxidase subunit I [Planctomycetota bacterium]|nr:cbb3-type cytochrome c oxidase subunit I [Planctomycetota bacterium]